MNYFSFDCLSRVSGFEINKIFEVIFVGYKKNFET